MNKNDIRFYLSQDFKLIKNRIFAVKTSRFASFKLRYNGRH